MRIFSPFKGFLEGSPWRGWKPGPPPPYPRR